jgi:hypothetical protein
MKYHWTFGAINIHSGDLYVVDRICLEISDLELLVEKISEKKIIENE